MLDLDFILGLVSQLAGIDIAGQIAAVADSFAYNVLLWLLNILAVI